MCVPVGSDLCWSCDLSKGDIGRPPDYRRCDSGSPGEEGGRWWMLEPGRDIVSRVAHQPGRAAESGLNMWWLLAFWRAQYWAPDGRYSVAVLATEICALGRAE